ncbi:MAG: acetylornithine/succinylornithine family transaminase [Clostridia bacterium]|nr:acetylornithine/succinylornithine family transaminase [Clostridia bacterium]
MNTFEKDSKFVAPTYGRFPVEIVGGKGAILKGSDGKEYIDLGSGIAVNTFGACDSEWVDAVKAQLDKFAHTSNLYYTSPCADLAQMICERTGMKNVFFSNSGAEANECAIKVARRYGALNKGADYYTIVTLEKSFHGRTHTTLAATGQENFHKEFLPLTEGFVHATPNDINSLNEAVKNNKCCGIMIEIVQGEGGVNALDKEFIEEAARLCKENDLVLIIDEVQTGNGRTGKLYAYMHYGIKPDVVSTAKGLAGGLPLGATMLGEKVKDIFEPGLNGSTFGGNPVCCSGAVNVLSRLTDEFLEEVTKKANLIRETLSGAEGIESISGLGLMMGIKTTKEAKEVVNYCIDKGVLVLTAKDKVRLLPPLNIETNELIKALDIIKEACKL